MMPPTSITVAPLVARLAHTLASDVVTCAVLAASTQTLTVGAKRTLLTPWGAMEN